MKTDEQVKQALEGADPEQVLLVLYGEIETLLANDPEYFEGNNSIKKTLNQLTSLITA